MPQPESLEKLETELREERLKKVQWMRAWIAYSEMHKDEQLKLRSNLSRNVPSYLSKQHNMLLEAHSKLMSKLSPNRRAILTNMGRNLVRKTASPRITDEALGSYARFDTTKLVRACPFLKEPLPDLIVAPYDWYSQPDDTPSLWAYEKMSIHLKKGKIIKPADWYSGDEPYALSVTTYYKAPKDSPSEGIAFEDFETSHKTHKANPSSGLGAGDEFEFTNSMLVKDLYLRDGIAAWSTAISLYEADAPDREALNEAFDSAQGVFQDIATVAGVATNIPPSVPYIQIIAAAVQKAAQIASGFLDLVQSFLSIFEDSDDFLGNWGISETTTYLYTGTCPPEQSRQRSGTVSGTGAMYRASIDISLTGCVRVHDQPDLVWPVDRIASGQIDKGKNSLGMPDLANYAGYRPIVHFFPDNTINEDIESAIAWISDIEDGGAVIVGCTGAPPEPGIPIMSFRPFTKRVKKKETALLQIPHPGFPGGKMPFPFAATQDGLVAAMVINEFYKGLANIPPGSGHVRYKWNMKAIGKGKIVR